MCEKYWCMLARVLALWTHMYLIILLSVEPKSHTGGAKKKKKKKNVQISLHPQHTHTHIEESEWHFGRDTTYLKPKKACYFRNIHETKLNPLNDIQHTPTALWPSRFSGFFFRFWWRPPLEREVAQVFGSIFARKTDRTTAFRLGNETTWNTRFGSLWSIWSMCDFRLYRPSSRLLVIQ